MRLRGYDRLDVDAFLHAVADVVDELIRRNEELEERCAELSGKVETMVAREETFQRALVAVNELREEANSRASALRQRAESDSERTLTDAEERARRIREEAEREAERLRGEAADLAQLRERVIHSLSEMLRAQLRVVEEEAERLGLDLARLHGREGGKIVSISQKAEGDWP